MGANVEATRWLTYDDLAAALGITPDSARRLVGRRKWPRKPGNDGRTLVAVPAERLPTDSPPDVTPDAGPGIIPDALPDVRGGIVPDVAPAASAVPPDTPSPVQLLQARVAELEGELRAERERSAGLAAVVEAERRHAAEIRSDRDAWRGQAERLAARSWWPFRRVG